MKTLLEECLKDNEINGLNLDGEPRTVLVVDNASFIRQDLIQVLVGAGYEVAGEAANGKEAIRQYKELQPDLVTMDIIMPEVDGIQATKDIVASDPNARIVLVTAVGSHDLVREGIMRGAKDFVLKPVKKETLKSFLRALRQAAA